MTDDFMGGGRRETPPMGEFDAELVARVKEIFYAYDNRRSADNRAAQSHLGPSEIGTPCDRRIAMQLMRIPPVNPGGDGWAAFVGTAIHDHLAKMFQWANAGTGRFATEIPLGLPSTHVPRGTADRLDRTMCLLVDDKCMGSSSLSKLRHDGPSPTYRVQLHVYAYGATLRGEVIERVALLAWPREAATLKGLCAWSEPYDKQIALDALARVDRIADALQTIIGPPHEAAGRFPINSDGCRFCPHHLPNSKDLSHGCSGKK